MTSGPPAATITLVAAVARNGVIGRDGALPWHLPGELQRFKALTMGHVLVMGRLTYDSIGRPLPGRTTVVVTRQTGWVPAGGPFEQVVVAHDLDIALEVATDVDDQVFVVGGGQVYAETIDLADRLVLTEVDQEPDGDAYFPDVDPAQWHAVSREPFDGWTVVNYRRSSNVS
jgi:dihydrofolate reductase